MKKTTRMMMMNAGKDKKDWDREYMDRGMESRFRDDRGREHYDNGRYAPMRSEYMAPYSNQEQYKDYPGGVPPVYQRKSRKVDYRPMDKIGFSVDGEMGRADEFDRRERREVEYMPSDEMAHRKGERTSGYAIPNETHLTKEMAKEWTSHMENEDGTIGAHWTLDQAKQVMAQKEIDGSPVEFWVALNATYSDLCKVFKKYGINTIDAYVDFAKAFWLDDQDAVPNKLAAYYESVVEH